MDKNLGLTIKRLRKTKNLEAKALQGPELSYSHLMKVEKGEASLTFEKLYYLLQTMNVTFEEFERSYLEFSDMGKLLTNRQATQAFWNHNVLKLRQLLKEARQALKSDPANQRLKLNLIEIKASLHSLGETEHITEKEISTLFQHLKNINEWSNYELWLFGNCLNLFSYLQICELTNHMIYPKSNVFKSASTQNRINFALLNIISQFIELKEFKELPDYFDYLEKHIRSDLDTYERANLTYLNKLFNFRKFPTDTNLQEVKACIKAFEILGCYTFSEIMSLEVAKYANEFA